VEMMDILDITILYVEDEVVILNSVAMILENRVKRVFTAQNGEEGLRLFNKFHPDVVLADISMPVMDGLVMARKIKAIEPSTIIIVLSAFDKKENLLEAINVGVDRFLPKPLNYDNLLRIINDLHSSKVLERRVEKEKAAREIVEEELEKTEKKYQDLYDNAPDMYFSVYPDGTVKNVNQFGAEYLGYTKRELIGSSVWQVVHNDDLKIVKKELSEIFKKREEFSELEFRKVRKDGSILLVHERTQLIFDDNGEAQEIRIICRDITDRKRIQEALIESEERYRLVAEQTGQIVYDVDVINKKIEIVGAIEKVLGYKEDEMSRLMDYGQALKLINPDDKDHVMKVVDKAVKNSSVFNVEFRMLTKDNHYIFVENNGVCLKGEKGETIRIIGTVADITTRKENETRLQEMHEYIRNLIESSLIMFISVDNDRNIIEFNSAAEKNFGYKRKEVLGKHVKMLYSDADECNRIGEILEERDTFYGEVVNKRKNGEEFISYLSAAIMRDSKGNKIGSVGNSIDITESKEKERALRLSEERYRRLVETAQNGFSLLDLEGNIVFCNKHKAKMFGYKDPSELIGISGVDLVAPDDRDRFVRKLKNMVESGSDMMNVEVDLIRKDGSIFPADFRASIVHDDEGNPKQIMDTMTDLSLRAANEKAIKDTKDKDVDIELLRELPIAVLEFDKAGQIKYINKQAVLLSGYPAEELLLMNIGKLFDGDTAEKSSINTYFADILHKKPSPSTWDGALRKADGSDLQVEITWTYKMDEHERIVGFIGVVREV